MTRQLSGRDFIRTEDKLKIREGMSCRIRDYEGFILAPFNFLLINYI